MLLEAIVEVVTIVVLVMELAGVIHVAVVELAILVVVQL